MQKDKKNRVRGGRRVGRELAFQVLYSINFLEEHDVEKCLNMVEHFARDMRPPASDRSIEFAKELVKGTITHLDKVDKVIETYSKNWKLSRIAKVELTILRLSIFEMVYRDDIPVKVAINEGIELSKKFGDEKSRKFVNGILDAVAKSINRKDL